MKTFLTFIANVASQFWMSIIFHITNLQVGSVNVNGTGSC
jgi:hypothetical protein